MDYKLLEYLFSNFFRLYVVVARDRKRVLNNEEVNLMHLHGLEKTLDTYEAVLYQLGWIRESQGCGWVYPKDHIHVFSPETFDKLYPIWLEEDADGRFTNLQPMRFLKFYDGVYTCIDNRDYHAWTEDFKSFRQAMLWLQDK